MAITIERPDLIQGIHTVNIASAWNAKFKATYTEDYLTATILFPDGSENGLDGIEYIEDSKEVFFDFSWFVLARLSNDIILKPQNFQYWSENDQISGIRFKFEEYNEDGRVVNTTTTAPYTFLLTKGNLLDYIAVDDPNVVVKFCEDIIETTDNSIYLSVLADRSLEDKECYLNLTAVSPSYLMRDDNGNRLMRKEGWSFVRGYKRAPEKIPITLKEGYNRFIVPATTDGYGSVQLFKAPDTPLTRPISFTRQSKKTAVNVTYVNEIGGYNQIAPTHNGGTFLQKNTSSRGYTEMMIFESIAAPEDIADTTAIAVNNQKALGATTNKEGNSYSIEIALKQVVKQWL